jgi:excisionase family DNA binding protein
MSPLSKKELAERPLTTEETAEYFKVTLRTVQRWIAGGIIRASRIGGLWRISHAEIHRLMEEGSNK